jgi:hypothetical protein
MAAPAFLSTSSRGLRLSLASLVLTASLLTGCHRTERDLAQQVDGLKTEVDDTKRKLGEAEKGLAAKQGELAATAADLEAAKRTLAEKIVALAERDTQWRAAQTELETLKKRDTFVFSDIRAAQEQGRSTVALSRYQQFVKDYPNSPFVSEASAAIAVLSTETEREAQRRANVFDPKRQERETLRLFGEGLLTPKELAPLLKNRTRAQVLAMLGRPNHVFPEGAEIGYVDKVTNPATGTKGMLIITFDANGVATALRVDYAGPKLIP